MVFFRDDNLFFTFRVKPIREGGMRWNDKEKIGHIFATQLTL